MSEVDQAVVLPPRIRPGDRVRLVSPASFPSDEMLAEAVRTLVGWGLTAEVGEHALDRHGYMAGRDEDRLADLNDAYRDPGVRAVIATRGGAGAYRIADGIDFAAVRADPKPLVGFSDITNLHLALWRHCRIAGIHGWLVGPRSAEATRRLLLSGEPTVLHRDPGALTAAVEVSGTAAGHLVGGHLGSVVGFIGAGLPSLDGAILFLETPRTIGLGQVDRHLTHLMRSGSLRGLRGVALGRFPGFEDYTDRGWNVIDVLRDRLGALGVPVLGGVDVGHGDDPLSVPLGPVAELDVDAGTLTVGPAVH
ncbi:LD-carboxypeptidase [Actinosynnema sp. NPDC050801]|jgi:muramoyltetrapeptide carboxypeptidase|uniref:S66 peptidase family protein n=1 Tax=unclassified Actinosynnema TaxID=2637065 RepID=UPI003403477A